MLTEISGAGLSHSVVSQAGALSAQRSVGAVRAGLQSSEVTQDERSSSSTQVVGVYAQLSVRKDEMNSVASVVREVGDAVEKASKLLDKMESSLGEIVKMYPPYPVDSPQRISLLNKIDGLRKQIDDLTFPPPESVSAVDRLLGTKDSSSTISSDSSVALEDKLAAVKERMWDIPTLDPAKTSDEDVAKVLQQVKEANSSVKELQSGMWKDVVTFVKSAESPEMQSETADMRDQMARLGGRSISSNPRQLEQVAELK